MTDREYQLQVLLTSARGEIESLRERVAEKDRTIDKLARGAGDGTEVATVDTDRGFYVLLAWLRLVVFAVVSVCAAAGGVFLIVPVVVCIVAFLMVVGTYLIQSKG